MKKPGGVEAHVRQTLADYEWLVELAQERVDLYCRVLAKDGPRFEVVEITAAEVIAHRYRYGDTESLCLPLSYLWAADLATLARAEEERAQSEAVLQTHRQDAAQAREKRARDRLSWRKLLLEYGSGGPPSE